MLYRAWQWILVCMLSFGLGSAALAQTAAYQVKPGDKLRIEVFEDSSLNREVLVLPDGTISVPLAGTLPASGRSVDQISASVSQRLAPNYAVAPTVHVSIAALSAPKVSSRILNPDIDIFVLGAVGDPGRKAVAPGITMLQFLAVAGGLNQFAADKRIELIRTDSKTGDVTTYLFNYRLPQGGAGTISGSTELQAGDVVKVPQKRLFE